MQRETNIFQRPGPPSHIRCQKSLLDNRVRFQGSSCDDYGCAHLIAFVLQKPSSTGKGSLEDDRLSKK